MTISTIISIITLGLCLLFFISCRAWLEKRTGQDRILTEFREEVSKLIAEIDAATDRDAILIEDRIKSLKTLLEDVDKRIILYGQEMSRRQDHARTYAELGKKRLSATAPKTITEPPVPPVDEEPPLIHAETVQTPPVPKTISEQVTELSRAGFSPNLIAARLGVSISEVELAIAIVEKKER
ncbi:MAG: hypothetical protein LBH75_04875 [Treponema sp.]|jgi:hypothetical protein|nr:hypothetical protein [Treponema sp.]